MLKKKWPYSTGIVSKKCFPSLFTLVYGFDMCDWSIPLVKVSQALNFSVIYIWRWSPLAVLEHYLPER